MKWVIIGIVWMASVVTAYFIGNYFGVVNAVGQRTSHGRFLGLPKAEWLDERDMRLLDDFVYIDPNNSTWLAPKGSVVNGASIPKVFWNTVGPPFVGKYRNASIVHDVACVEKKLPHDQVHRMFYYACRAGGLPENQAKQMYYAVAKYGPRWAYKTQMEMLAGAGPNDEEPNVVERIIAVELPTEVPTEADVEWAAQYFADNDPTIDEIEQLAAEREPGR